MTRPTPHSPTPEGTHTATLHPVSTRPVDPPTWGETINQFLAWGRKKSKPFSDQTVSSYRSGLSTWATQFRERGITDSRKVTSADIESIIESKSDWAGSTKGQRLNALSSLFKWARKHGLVETNPVEDVERPARDDNEWPRITLDDFRRMRLQVRDVQEDALLLTLAMTGVRHQELLSIDLSDLIPDLPGVQIKRGKGGKAREVPFSPALVEALNRYLRERPDDTDCPALFVTAKGRRLTQRVFRRMWHRWLRDAGLADSGYVVHSCRVTFNTLLAWAGVDERTIAELMGHSPRNMTVKYTRTDMPRKVAAVALLEATLFAPSQGVFGGGAMQVAGAGVEVGSCRVQPRVPEHLRQRVEVATALQHEARERMPQMVEGALFGDPRAAESAAQDGREPLASQWGVGVGREQPLVLTQRAQFQPISQGAYQTQGHRQDAALAALPALDPHGAFRQIDGRDLQREQLRLAQPGEQQQPQHGAVAVGVGDGGLPLGSREEALALLHGQPGGERAFPLRDADAQERVRLRVPAVAQVLPQGTERGEAAGDAVGLVPFGSEPGDVLTHDLPVNVLRGERAGTHEPTEQPEVGGVGSDGRGTAVALDFQI